jgi:hypothetical protein
MLPDWLEPVAKNRCQYSSFNQKRASLDGRLVPSKMDELHLSLQEGGH